MPLSAADGASPLSPPPPDPSVDPPGLPSAADPEFWSQLQRLRRGGLDPEPLLLALEVGGQELDVDLLAALWGRLSAAQVRRLLALPALAVAGPLLLAGRRELPLQAATPAVQQAWLEPLLERHQQASPAAAAAWLELLAHFRDPRVAERLRRCCAVPAPAERPELLVLLPLLGRQRDPQDAPLLLRLALAPLPSACRLAALEGLALGLAAWPMAELSAGLEQLAGDLDPALAARAVDLLARLPGGAVALRRLQCRGLDPQVQQRLRRRLPPTPLVLVVHGRQGGVIPEELQHLARDLERRRGTPVLLQALTAPAPEPGARFWWLAGRAGGLTVVPLLLLPGGHVRHDLPALTAAWRQRAAAQAPAAPNAAGPPVVVRRQPFLGAWPAWQALLAQLCRDQAAGRSLRWLHHPLSGPLAERFLDHLARVLEAPGLATAYGAAAAALDQALPPAAAPPLLLPLTLAANRLSESLNMDPLAPSVQVLPPLLSLAAVRQFLLCSLEALP